jgi:hypothetical protein
MNRGELAVLEAMARISRYLDQPFSPKPDLLEQVRDYQRNGAFADLAILQLRRALASSVHYHAEANKVLAACRERRDRENRHFAETLAGRLRGRAAPDGLTPLHRLWKRTVAPGLAAASPTRGCSSSCSTGAATRCSSSCSTRSRRTAASRSASSPDGDGRVAGLPALSPLPTVTSHARGAIFLGELPNDPLVAETVFRDQDEAKTDKARFNQNAALGSRSGKLFLKGDLADGGQALLAALEDEQRRVVGCVQRGRRSDRLVEHRRDREARPEDITAFKPALRGALKAGRACCHRRSRPQPVRRQERCAGNGKTPRYTALGKHDAVPEGFIEIDLAGSADRPSGARSPGARGAYLGGPQVGFHGGVQPGRGGRAARVDRARRAARRRARVVVRARRARRAGGPARPVPRRSSRRCRRTSSRRSRRRSSRCSTRPTRPTRCRCRPRCSRGSASTRRRSWCCCARPARRAPASSPSA